VPGPSLVQPASTALHPNFDHHPGRRNVKFNIQLDQHKLAFDTCATFLALPTSGTGARTLEQATAVIEALQKRHMEWAGVIHIGIHNDWKNMPSQLLLQANAMIGSTQAAIDAKEQQQQKQHRLDLNTIANAIAGSKKKGRRNNKKKQNQPFPQGGAAKQQKN
jgi:hypothetical protein